MEGKAKGVGGGGRSNAILLAKIYVESKRVCFGNLPIPS